MKKRITSLIVVLSIIIMSIVPYTAYSATDYVGYMTTKYNEALSLFGGSSFNGYCGACVCRQLQAIGITSGYWGMNGNQVWDNYCNLSNSSGGYPISSYSATAMSMRDLLTNMNNANNAGGYTYIALGFEKGSSSANGQAYGHTLLIYAVYNGNVYYTESWGTTINTKTISSFCSSYGSYTASNGCQCYVYEGAICFGGSITPVDPPSNCWININKGAESTYTISETVKFTYHAENVNYYTLEIYKDGSPYDCFDTYSGEYSRAFTETGRYNVVVSAVNGGGRTYSGWISWNVVSAPAPSNCYISIDKGPESTYNVSDTVYFTYHAENVKYYIFEIYKNGASYECTETYYGQCGRTFTQPGRYNSVVTAVGDGGRTSSGWISWNVVDPSAVGPNVPYVAVNNRNVFPQEQFRINFWAETAKYYNVKITKNGTTYKDEILYVGYYDTSLSDPGDYSIQVTAINDYGSSSAYDGVKVIGTVPEEPKITTTYDCYGTNEDVEIVLTPGKYTQTSYMTIRKCTDVWETVFSGSVTDLTTKTYRFTTAGYYQIEYQNSNIYGASPCAAKAIRIYDSVPDKPMVLSDKSIYEISENINITLLAGGNIRSAYMSVYNSSNELVFSQDVSGRDAQTLSFDMIGEYTINYQTANTLGQSEIAVLTFCIGKKETVASFDANGGVMEETNKTVLRDLPYGQLPIPHCQGKKFVGWFTNAENGELIESNTIVTALDDHILYAVWQDLPSTETIIMKKSNYSVVNITVHNLDETANVVFATYKNGKLSDIQIEEYNGDDLSLATFFPYDTVKVMIWDNMSSMRPLCENEVLH